MAQKTVKKTTAKATATKKTVAKKPVAKKAPAKKPAKVIMPAVEMHDCKCGHACACGEQHMCRCHGGSKFGRVMKKLIWAVVIFALGYFAAGFFAGPRPGFHGPRGPRVNFADGCMVEESVKCQKLRDALPAMDINQDGCITRDEFRAVKREMRREIREMQIEEVEDTHEEIVEEVAEEIAE